MVWFEPHNDATLILDMESVNLIEKSLQWCPVAARCQNILQKTHNRKFKKTIWRRPSETSVGKNDQMTIIKQNDTIGKQKERKAKERKRLDARNGKKGFNLFKQDPLACITWRQDQLKSRDDNDWVVLTMQPHDAQH